MNYENLKIEKSLYTCGGGFTPALTAYDPDEDYVGTPLEGLDAYQRQLKRFGIRVKGKNSDTVEKFFKTGDSAALFPEYVSRAVLQGAQNTDVIDKITASTTVINSADYRSITSVNDENSKALYDVGEGAKIPETAIKVQENLVSLHKRGRMLVASYEAVKYQRLDLFTVTLAQIGAYIARSQLADAVDVLINGDGNSNPAQVINTETQGVLTYGDLIKLWTSFDPYTMTTLIVPGDVMAKILNMSEFRDSFAGLDFHATGKIVTPLGCEVIRCDSVPAGKIVALDKSCALEKVQSGSVTTEFDKLIDRQLERAAVTCTAGFSKIYPDACKVMSI